MSGPSETSTLDLAKQDVLAFLSNIVIFILSCWTWDLWHRKVFVMRRLIFLLLFAWTSFFVHPPIAYAALFTWTIWSAILWSEVTVNEIREFKRRRSSGVRIKIGQFMGQYWKVAAILRPSSLDCDVQYHPVTICDTSVLDDPFWPNHISTVFTVEWRRHNMIWTTVRIWQVSLLNGGKKNVHEFHQFWQQTDGRPFKYNCTRAERVHSFQSRDIIFIIMRLFDGRAVDYAMLFVYDTRLKKSAVYDMKLPNRRNTYAYSISVTCIGRLVDTDGSVEGWRIRMLDAASVEQPAGRRACIINETYDLRQVVSLVRSEEILFGQFFGSPLVRRILTSRRHFGLQAFRSDETQSPIVLFNETTSEYASFRTFDDLILMDSPLATYVYSFPTEPTLRLQAIRMPVFLNDREAILSPRGIVLRTTFRPSSLKYLMAKSLFESNPQLRNQLNAEQFRQATGIGGMDGHFG